MLMFLGNNIYVFLPVILIPVFIKVIQLFQHSKGPGGWEV